MNGLSGFTSAICVAKIEIRISEHMQNVFYLPLKDEEEVFPELFISVLLAPTGKICVVFLDSYQCIKSQGVAQAL